MLTKLAHVIAAIAAAIGCLCVGGPAAAQYFGAQSEKIPARHDNILTRNKVVLFNNVDQADNQFYYVAKDFKIRFIGLNGESQDYALLDYYQGQVFVNKDNLSVIVRPPYATPYSGYSVGTFKAGQIDVHDIPIDPAIGPIVAVIIEASGGQGWKIDKIIADGRTFSFVGVDAQFRRYATHFLFGSLNGNYQVRPPQLTGAIQGAQGSYAAIGQIYPPLSLFPDAGVRARYASNELYSEPTRKDHLKTVTVRLKFGDIGVGNASKQAGPVLRVKLIGNKSESAVKLADGPLIFNERFVSFDVDGDFHVKAVDVDLVGDAISAFGACNFDKTKSCRPLNDGKSANIEEVGLTIEQGIEPELVFQDKAKLSIGGVTHASLRRFGQGATVRFSDLKSREAIAALKARTLKDTFHAIIGNEADAAAFDLFLSGVGKQIDGYTFEQWFFGSSTDTTALGILAYADEAFNAAGIAKNVHDAWNGGLKARIKKTIDERRNALKFIDRISGAVDDQRDAFNAELFAADKFLGLETAMLQTTALEPADETEFLDGLSTGLNALGAFTSSAAPLVSTCFYSFVAMVDVTRLIAAVEPKPSRQGFTQQSTSDGVGDNNRFRIAVANEILGYKASYDRVKDALDKVRTLVVRDAGLLAELADNQIYFSTNIDNNETGFDLKNYATNYLAARDPQIRRQLITRLLPIRGVMYGVPVEEDETHNLFPPGQKWPGERFGPRCRVNANPKSAECDEILAYSGYLVLEEALVQTKHGAIPPPPGSRNDRVPGFMAHFHKWKLAFGSGVQAPRLATEDKVTGVTYPTAWAWVRSAFRDPIDIFNLLAFGPTNKFVIKEVEYRCEKSNLSCARNPDSAGSEDAYRIFQLPGWRRTDGLTVRIMRGKMTYDQDRRCDLRPCGSPYLANSHWATGRSGSGDEETFEFDLRLYSYKLADGVSRTAIVPTAWYVLHERDN